MFSEEYIGHLETQNMKKWYEKLSRNSPIDKKVTMNFIVFFCYAFYTLKYVKFYKKLISRLLTEIQPS